MINPKNLNSVHRKKKGMKNDERDENSPVEIIEGRLKRLRTNEIDARKRLRLREEEGWEGGKTKAGRTHEYLEEKTPVERMQRIHTSRKDTRLRTPDSRRRREGGWEKNN